MIALQALEHLLDSVICVQRDGTVTFLNQAACDMLQLSPTRVLNKKRIDSILSVDDRPYDLAQMHSDDARSKIVRVSPQAKNPFQARIVTIPFSITQSDIALISIKDLSHEEELFQKYQSQMRLKDQRIHESQLINSILQSIRLTKDPHSMVRQIALMLMKELNVELSLMVTLKPQLVSCDIVTAKEHRAQYVDLLAAKNIAPEKFAHDSTPVTCLEKQSLPTPLNTLWPTDIACKVELYHGSEPIILLMALKSAPSQEVTALISSIRDQTSLSISSSHFEKLSHVDELTNVFNRRYFIQQSSVFFNESLQNGSDCSVVLMDLDHFKQINDNEGHLFGDEVLRAVGKLLQSTTRMSDIVARYGGEEFILFLPETNSTEAKSLAERIRTLLAKNEIAYGKSARHVTASFGIASRIHTSASKVELLIDYADQALYDSKESGRNKVTLYEP